MHILFLNLYGLAPARGAETFTTELLRHLKPHFRLSTLYGHSPHAPQSQFSGSVSSRLQKRLFLDLPSRQVFWFTLRHLPAIIKLKPDLIVPLNGFWQLLLLKLIQPFIGFKIAITGHSGPGWDERWNLYLKPDVFIATTKPTLDWARSTCPSTRSVLIPYGIDPKLYQVKPARLDLKPPIILCPSALVLYKRIHLAVQAVAQIPEASLLILGSGSLQHSLRTLCTKLLPGRFLLTRVNPQDMPRYYAASAAVTLPSLPQENSPMVFLEAQAAGKITVTTDSPRHRWMLESNGIYTNPADIQAYATALRQALHSPKASTRPLTKFLWSSVSTQYINLYKSLNHD